ncbi:MAG: AAA family ATPase [Bacteroidetes bacterium]|nr:AAA family ATPase [Bacteroidota bacterium]
MKRAISILDLLHFDCPTQEQKQALLAMAEFVKEDNTEDFLILCGAAGTGKTSITSALIAYLNQKEVSYRIAAPTSRAARILGRKTNAQNSTIHSMIYNVDANPETGEVRFKLKMPEDKDYCIFIIDEASMVNAETNSQDGLFVSSDSLLNDLVKFVKRANPKNKVILLGDRNQLPPINEKDSYALMPDYLGQHYNWKGGAHLLTEVKRQEDGSYILKNAVNIRKAIDEGREQADIEAFKFYNLSAAVTKYVEDYKSHEQDYCISIGCTHKSNQFFNDIVRKRLYGEAVKPVEQGDLMLVTQSWNRSGQKLYNGDHVTIEEICLDKIEQVGGLHFVPVKVKSRSISGEEMTVEDYLLLDSLYYPSGSLPTEKEKVLRRERYTKNKVYRESGKPEDDRYVGAIRLTYGHSITCNKAQGGEWEKVFVNTYYVPNLKWSYTAVTRAKSVLVKY